MNSKLLPVLNDTKLQSSNNALYQFLKQLLDFIGSSSSSSGGSSSGGSSSGGGIQSKVVSVTHDQILTLPSTLVPLITGPASGSRIKIIALSAINKFTVAYTGVDPVICTLKIATPADQWISILTNDNTIPLSNVTNFLQNANNILVDFVIPYMQSNFYVYPNDPVFPGGNAIDWSGASVNMGLDNNGSVVNLGGGDPDNTIQVTIHYIIEKL